MADLRTATVAVVAGLVLVSCGGREADQGGTGTASPERSPEASAPSPAPPEPSTPEPSGAAPGPAATTEQLFAGLDAAIARQTSVRQEMGNLNHPAAAVLRQEYGDGRDALSFVMDLGPQVDPIQVYRVDGLVYVQGQEPQAMEDLQPDDTAVLAQLLRSDVRQDFRRMAAQASRLSYLGEEEIGGAVTRHYRVRLTLVPGANAATLPALLRGPKPADLWIGAGGLPVRLDVKYSEPIGGIPGTGVSRTTYSAWSEPLNLDPENLDWG